MWYKRKPKIFADVNESKSLILMETNQLICEGREIRITKLFSHLDYVSLLLFSTINISHRSVNKFQNEGWFQWKIKKLNYFSFENWAI